VRLQDVLLVFREHLV